MDHPTRTGPKDVLLHLLALLTLYLTATHVGVLFFQLINARFADPLTDGSWADSPPYLWPLRWAIAMLVIVFPMHLGVTRMIERGIAHDPARRELRTRRWFLHGTLALAAVIAASDLVTIVHRFLSGELTVRFLLKVAVILCIAGTVFAYERGVLRRDGGHPTPAWFRPFTAAIITLITVGVVTGFFIAGTPRSERNRKFDAQRVNDLGGIQWRIVEHWRATGALPPSLDALRDALAGYTPPRNPETNTAYEYRVTGPLTFELCAAFRTASPLTRSRTRTLGYHPPPIFANVSFEHWTHGVGRTCFTRTIDPARHGDRTPPVPRPVPP